MANARLFKLAEINDRRSPRLLSSATSPIAVSPYRRAVEHLMRNLAGVGKLRRAGRQGYILAGDQQAHGCPPFAHRNCDPNTFNLAERVQVVVA